MENVEARRAETGECRGFSNPRQEKNTEEFFEEHGSSTEILITAGQPRRG